MWREGGGIREDGGGGHFVIIRRTGDWEGGNWSVWLGGIIIAIMRELFSIYFVDHLICYECMQARPLLSFRLSFPSNFVIPNILPFHSALLKPFV